MRKLTAAGIITASLALGIAGAALADDYDQVTFAYATFNNIPTEETLDTVEEEINKITREKIGAEITLKPIGIADYSSSISLSLQAGEKIDVFQSLGDYVNCVTTGMAMDITDMVEEDAKESMELFSEEWLKACMVGGRLYGLPTNKPVALTNMVIYRKDIADELGIDMSQVNTVEDLTDVLLKVKEGHPEMTPMAPVENASIGLNRNYKELDSLGDDYHNPLGVLMGDSLEVVDLYSSEEFRKNCELAREWYENDLVMKDAATTTSMAAELMSSGNYFCYLAAYSYPEEDTAASLAAQMGNGLFEIGAKMVGDAYLGTSDINALTWMVTSNSKVSDAALKFLNLTFTDEDIINLVIYGLEGRDYVLDEEGFMSYPEGQDASTVPYTAQLSCGTFGTFFLQYPMAGTNKESIEWEKEQNETAKCSPAMGFTFDNSSVQTQYTACRNVISQYLPGLYCGSVDPATEIDSFVEALKGAGYEDILNAKAEQLKAWSEEQ